MCPDPDFELCWDGGVVVWGCRVQHGRQNGRSASDERAHTSTCISRLCPWKRAISLTLELVSFGLAGSYKGSLYICNKEYCTVFLFYFVFIKLWLFVAVQQICSSNRHDAFEKTWMCDRREDCGSKLNMTMVQFLLEKCHFWTWKGHDTVNYFNMLPSFSSLISLISQTSVMDFSWNVFLMCACGIIFSVKCWHIQKLIPPVCKRECVKEKVWMCIFVALSCSCFFYDFVF